MSSADSCDSGISGRHVEMKQWEAFRLAGRSKFATESDDELRMGTEGAVVMVMGSSVRCTYSSAVVVVVVVAAVVVVAVVVVVAAAVLLGAEGKEEKEGGKKEGAANIYSFSSWGHGPGISRAHMYLQSQCCISAQIAGLGSGYGGTSAG